ncbi:MAG: hypothetical protein AAFU41_11005 [Pseudomonadota bacterium]
MKPLSLAIAASLSLATFAQADTTKAAMQDYLQSSISAWAHDPVLVAAIIEQNAQTSGFDQAAIDQQDQLWRAFVGSDDATIIADVVNNPAADFLRNQVGQSGGAITEAFIVDAKGLNVAASEPTSDYWQGDEAKFTETYLMGPYAVHLGDVELDDSTQAVQGQVSMTIIDTETGEPIGALTVGLNVAALM